MRMKQKNLNSELNSRNTHRKRSGGIINTAVSYCSQQNNKICKDPENTAQMTTKLKH